jgi:hypothetical protein
MASLMPYSRAMGSWMAHSTGWLQWRAVTSMASSVRRVPMALR